MHKNHQLSQCVHFQSIPKAVHVQNIMGAEYKFAQFARPACVPGRFLRPSEVLLPIILKIGHVAYMPTAGTMEPVEGWRLPGLPLEF